MYAAPALLGALLVLAAQFAQADEGYICLHSIKVSGYSAGKTKGPFDPDPLPKNAVAFLKESGLAKDCIDVRTTNQNTQDSTVGLLLNGQMSLADQNKLREAVCKGSATACKASVSFNCEKTSALSFKHDHAKIKKKYISRSMGSVPRMPKFSEACETGKTGWQDAASSPESRELLQQAGVNIHDVRSLSIESESGGNLWTFGFPSPRRLPAKTKMEVTPAATIDSGADGGAMREGVGGR